MTTPTKHHFIHTVFSSSLFNVHVAVAMVLLISCLLHGDWQGAVDLVLKPRPGGKAEEEARG